MTNGGQDTHAYARLCARLDLLILALCLTELMMHSMRQIRNLYAVLLCVGFAFPLQGAERQGNQAAHNKVAVGAIRWDAWHGNRGIPGRAVEKSLGPLKWHYRLPFFAEVIGNDRVRIDGSTQEIIDREIEYAAVAGLDYWAFVTYPTDNPMSLGLQRYLTSSLRSQIRFCLITECTRWLQPSFVERVVDLMCERGYQTVLDGRPLLYLAFIKQEKLDKFHDGQKGFRLLLNAFRAKVRESGLLCPYIVVMDAVPSRGRKWVDAFGCDAISSYATGWEQQTISYRQLAANTERFWERCRGTGAPVVPIIMTGWDRRPRIENPVPWEPWQKTGVNIEHYCQPGTPTDIAAHLRNALEWSKKHRDTAIAQTVIIYAWNEFDEGGWLAPTISEGTARLGAVAEVLVRPRLTDLERSYWVHVTLGSKPHKGYWGMQLPPCSQPTELQVRNAARLLTGPYATNRLYLLYHKEITFSQAKEVFSWWRRHCSSDVEIVPTLVMRTYDKSQAEVFTTEELRELCNFFRTELHSSHLAVFDVYPNRDHGPGLAILAEAFEKKLIRLGIQPEESIKLPFVAAVQDTWSGLCHGKTNTDWLDKGFGAETLRQWIMKRNETPYPVAWDLVVVAWDYKVTRRGEYPGYDDAARNMPLPAGRNRLAIRELLRTARPDRMAGFSSDLTILQANSVHVTHNGQARSFYETLKRGRIYDGYYAKPFAEIALIFRNLRDNRLLNAPTTSQAEARGSCPTPTTQKKE
ncbi:MAG: hypothetical protein JSV03_10975 [Planctomycetota bacterium]|nr:MAG: hypothetical protein JSV03_10975 [Planctomycetota bacterium]